MTPAPTIREVSKPIDRVKMGIYLLVGLYASYAITFGTTFFSEFERIMIFAAILSVAIGVMFVWLAYELKLKRHRLE